MCAPAHRLLRRGDDMTMTLAELTKAIQQHIDLEMDAEVAQGMAEHALGFFGFYNRIIDNECLMPFSPRTCDKTHMVENTR